MVPIAPPRRRLLPSILFALLLIVATVAVALGRDATDATTVGTAATLSSTTAGPSPAPTGGVLAAESRTGATVPTSGVPAMSPLPRVTTTTTKPSATPKAHTATVKPKTKATTRSTPKRMTVADLHGRNHVWMPALGLDRSVAGYSCSNQSYPGNRVYRWGCAGSNNVYLFGHASGVFKGLHDAYVRGNLRKGMVLFYADGSGNVHRYTVSWWKVTTATKGTWAYAAQSTPSLTLQTCLGSQSQYRLIVRLSRAD
jgi:Sortase domain